MVTCQKWLVLLQLVVVGTLAIPSPSSANARQSETEDAPTVRLDSDTGDDRELKSDDDGYDFLSIDQLFLNNPQYRQLISDLQAHTFGSNWRRKRDVAEHELPDAFRSEEAALSTPRASTVPTTTTGASTVAASTSTATETLVTDVASNRDITSAATTSDLPKAAALTSTPTKPKESPKEVTKPSTASSISVTSSSSSSSTTTTTTATSTANRGSSTVATSAAYGSSGSTEASVGRNATVELTTAAAPIRASTPRRLSHKNSSNKNKNKLSAAAAAAAAQTASSKPPTSASVGPSTVNVNKVSVSSNAVASSSSSSSSNQISQQTSPAVAIPATENGTITGPVGNNKDKTGLAPTKYHYYPHNQHIYFLPECAIQQVCNAVYVRLNYTQPLCACPPRYRDPCSASLNEDDNHTIKLVGNQQKRAITLAKTCENTNELRDCRAPKDWSILALQNTRTGKSHYLVICKCPPHYRLEGPLAHDQPTYAGLPGINVYGMLCVPPETSSYYASKPAKTPANVYNKWKIPSRQPVSSYRANSAAINAAVDNETESVSRTYQSPTAAAALANEA
ncbi:uncharacterized protein LOC128296971 [Anopheles moucheti]|uniref:uncharacterized protein LOC128296971 n=1 Tax=Anopheles moucheti TaxID=186751 RepID=UPI0022F068E5|nr:uncharacterized protein LOC128296971 [Anopheles moucheti]